MVDLFTSHTHTHTLHSRDVYKYAYVYPNLCSHCSKEIYRNVRLPHLIWDSIALYMFYILRGWRYSIKCRLSLGVDIYIAMNVCVSTWQSLMKHTWKINEFVRLWAAEQRRGESFVKCVLHNYQCDVMMELFNYTRLVCLVKKWITQQYKCQWKINAILDAIRLK